MLNPLANETNLGQSDLPPIPEKRYFTIGEVSRLCAVKPHVLRYWEQEFRQLNPAKRRGNRRYYQHKDVEMVRQIRTLRYHKGFTIIGAKQQLEEEREEASDLNANQFQPQLNSIIKDLEHIIRILDN